MGEYANHYIGAGGFVVNTDNQLLVVREKSAATNLWKLPGGHADKGEDLFDTARREVKEETGIDTEGKSLLAFRHQHKYRHGCSDIYFVAVMRPLSKDITPCPTEIEECKWMDLDEFIASKDTSDTGRHFAKLYRDRQAGDGTAIMPEKVLSYNKKDFNNVYSICDLPRKKQASSTQQKDS